MTSNSNGAGKTLLAYSLHTKSECVSSRCDDWVSGVDAVERAVACVCLYACVCRVSQCVSTLVAQCVHWQFVNGSIASVYLAK